MEETKKYSKDVLTEAETLAKLIASLPKDKAAGVAEVAGAYLNGANDCLRLVTREEAELKMA